MGLVAPLSVTTVVRSRAQTLRTWAEGGSIADACALGGCSRATLFRWRSRLEHDGLAGLVDPVRVGDRSDLAPELERAILLVRMLSYWNSGRVRSPGHHGEPRPDRSAPRADWHQPHEHPAGAGSPL